MIRRALTLVAVAVLAVGATALVAQPPHGPRGGGPAAEAGGPPGPGHGEGRGPDLLNPRFLARYLDLSDAQQEELRGILESHFEAVQPIHEEMRTLGGDLRALLESGNADPADVGSIVLEIQSLREELEASRQALIEEVRSILTPDQEEKLDTLLEIVEVLRNRGPHD